MNRDYEMNFKYDPDVANLPEELMEEAASIFETLERRKPGIDIINWEEKAEMDRISQRHGRGGSGGDFYGDDSQGPITESKPTSNNPREQELMNDLAGIMNAWEENDGSK